MVAEKRLMAPRKKPDATDTEPPEEARPEARPDTTATPLIVDDGKLLPLDVAFTAEQMASRPCF